MKKADLEKLLMKHGWSLKRRGASHELWQKDGKVEALPRHREIKETLARAIIRRLGLK